MRGWKVQDATARFVDTLGNDERFASEVRLYASQIEIFAKLTPPDLELLIQKARAVTYAPSETIFKQGTQGDTLHLVLSGKVLLLGERPNGGQQLVTERGIGESFGEIGLLTTSSERSLTAVAGPEGESLHLVLSRKVFFQVVSTHPVIGFRVYINLFESIQDRLKTLPGYFRNLVVWGYRSPIPKAESDTSVNPMNFPSSVTLGVVGVVVGLVNMMLVKALMPFLPHLLAQLVLAVAMMASAAFICFTVGQNQDKVQQRMIFQQAHPRCCAQCKFALFSERNGTLSCTFGNVEGLKVNFKPGVRMDAYTDCASFEASEGRMIRAAQRDTMSKD